MASAEKIWDAIVIGSGIGGLACAAALAKYNHRVMVLEQHHTAGGLTHTFSRNGFTFNVGVHYLSDMGPAGQAAEYIRWLSNDTIRMASLGPVYDIIHFPGGFQLQLSRPEAALKLDLKEKFPNSAMEIDHYFDALREAQQAGHEAFALRAMPEPLAKLYRLWKGRHIEKWCERTTGAVLNEFIGDPKLRAVLASQWGLYGGLPQESCFAIHAVVIRDFFNGAYYPVGSPSVFASALSKTIEQAWGEVEVNTRVTSLIFEENQVVGVRLADGAEYRGAQVVSDIGVRNTIEHLLPDPWRHSEWAQETLSLQPSLAYIGMYLGFEGDISANGASVSNHWIYETWDPDQAIWEDPCAQALAPCLYVSFPSLKDPVHDPGPYQRHTAELLAFTRWDAFAKWADSEIGKRPEGYEVCKAKIEANLLTQFGKHFPALVPLIKHHEISTPLTFTDLTGAQQGAMYGLEVTPRRFLSLGLNCKTPIPGLFLSGQDVGSPGVHGAMMGGILAAAAIDHRLFSRLR
jgi:all-trans-retinol 13,14-reductase